MLRKTSNSPSQQLLFLRTTTYDYFITIIISNITISNITIFTIFMFFVITNTNVVIFIIILSTVDVSTIKFSNFCYLFIYLFILFYFASQGFLDASCSVVVVLTTLLTTFQVISPYMNYTAYLTYLEIDHYFVNHIKNI